MDWLISQQDRSQLPPHPRECIWGPENPVPLSLLSGLTRVASEPHRANVVLPEGGLKEAWSWACIYKSYIVLGRWWCASFTSYRFMMFINIITSLGKASTNEINTATSFIIGFLKPFKLEKPPFFFFFFWLHLVTPNYGCYLEPLWDNGFL